MRMRARFKGRMRARVRVRVITAPPHHTAYCIPHSTHCTPHTTTPVHSTASHCTTPHHSTTPLGTAGELQLVLRVKS